ncbi:MAG: aerobic carbon-monoxide dehydrogenase large subunit [Alphaproteobacteria bacterium]|jgi:carbon-monoxide dehydrogenase large subunit/6-hydroxypseudooxynicotine dehydrogenase subunit gamma|nr:aerobic carbon-monoxide dehydrogenase large subunit [Alphaproteobacteria bacterium]
MTLRRSGDTVRGAMEPSDHQKKIIGASVTRLEDPPLVTGRGRFAADVSFPGQLHMRVVRARMAHARIVAVDLAPALSMPGVHAAWTSADLADIPPIDFRDDRVEPLVPYRQPVLARARVRYVGEPVAVVFADDPYQAEDAADAVTVELDELAPLMTADATAEFDVGLSTEPMVIEKAYGDLAAAFASAHAVVALDLSIGRHSGVPLETRGAIARHDQANDVLELHGAAKVPHRNQEQIAKILGRPLASVHLFEGHVGGGFGVRGELYPEDVLVCLAALKFGRPVKWIEDRHEHFIATNHSRQQRHKVRAAIDVEGRILGLEDDFLHDQGAYVRTHGARVVDLTAGMLPGPYRIPAYRAAGHYRLTNKTPAATYRSPGRYESTFVRERLMDAIAHRIGVDPVEVRRRNLIDKSEMPFERPLDALGDDVVLDSGDYAGLLAKTLDRLDWDKLKASLAQRRRAGETVGAGLAMFVEKSGLGPTDGVNIAVDGDGKVEVVTGGASLGQGFETVIAQICAEALGVDYAHVRVVHGQTNRIGHGVGAHATRATVMTGSATHVAALKLRAHALEHAAQLLQTPADGLTISLGRVLRKGMPAGPSLSLGEIAPRHPLAAEGWFRTAHMVYPYGVHVAVVAVDRDTGAVKVERYLIAYDVGRAVNPMLVEGQLVGGFAQGLGGALSEEFLYDDRGEPLSTTFADYLMPTAREVPPVDVLITEDAPSPLNPLGLKGAGEGGINAVGAAIASAIDDAIGRPGAITRLPVTPMRLKALLDSLPARPRESGDPGVKS